jgi:hypothetical protein
MDAIAAKRRSPAGARDLAAIATPLQTKRSIDKVCLAMTSDEEVGPVFWKC